MLPDGISFYSLCAFEPPVQNDVKHNIRAVELAGGNDRLRTYIKGSPVHDIAFQTFIDFVNHPMSNRLRKINH